LGHFRTTSPVRFSYTSQSGFHVRTMIDGRFHGPKTSRAPLKFVPFLLGVLQNRLLDSLDSVFPPLSGTFHLAGCVGHVMKSA